MSNIESGKDLAAESAMVVHLPGADGAAGVPAQPKQTLIGLVRPYHKWLTIVFIAMLIETAMSLAAPWPLKIIIDNVVGTHKMPDWLLWVQELPGGTTKSGLALWAGGRSS